MQEWPSGRSASATLTACEWVLLRASCTHSLASAAAPPFLAKSDLFTSTFSMSLLSHKRCSFLPSPRCTSSCSSDTYSTHGPICTKNESKFDSCSLSRKSNSSNV